HHFQASQQPIADHFRECQKESFPLWIGFNHDAMPVVEIVERLRQVEKVLSQCGWLGHLNRKLNVTFQLGGQVNEPPQFVISAYLEKLPDRADFDRTANGC